MTLGRAPIKLLPMKLRKKPRKNIFNTICPFNSDLGPQTQGLTPQELDDLQKDYIVGKYGFINV